MINYFQEKIDNGNNHIFTDISDYEYKTVDAINCIEEIDKKNTNYKQALNDIKRYVNHTDCCTWDNTAHEDILEIIDKVLGGSDE